MSVWWTLSDTMLLPVGAGLMSVGGLLGLFVGARVDPRKLPQIVAAFHLLVGAAAICT